MNDTAFRINAERLVILGWGRAILLQLAHPLIAAGVADHSAFRSGPATAAARLHQTVHSMLALTFGDEQAYARTIETIRGIHRRVYGRLRHSAGRFPAGTPYSAEDPDLLLWVHATLLESVVLIYDELVSPVSRQDRDAYCEEACGVSLALGARDSEVPRTWNQLIAYLDRMYPSGAIAVGPDARHVAGAVLAPPMSSLIWPATWINRTVTVGTLPEHIRSQYGFRWTVRHDRRLGRVMRWLKSARRHTPRALAWWADARRRRHAVPLPS